MKTYLNFFILISTFLLLSCNQKTNQSTVSTYGVEPYYFPIFDFSIPSVYVYKLSESGEYQYLKMHFDEEKSIFNTKVYNNDKVLVENSDEYIDRNGAHFTKYEVIQNNDTIDAKLIATDVFKWNIRNVDQLTWHIDYKIADKRIQIIKQRVIEEWNYNVEFNDSTYNTCVFRDKYKIIEEENGNESIYKFDQITYYAKGIGILNYTRKYSDGDLKITLVKIISEEEFNQL